MRALITTIGWSGAKVRSMSVIGTAPVLLERGLGVEAGHLRDDLLARAEAVVAVPLVGADRVAGDVARHAERVQVEPPPRVGGRVRGGEVVVRPGLQADGRVEWIAAQLARSARATAKAAVRPLPQSRWTVASRRNARCATNLTPPKGVMDRRASFLPGSASHSSLKCSGIPPRSARFSPWRRFAGTGGRSCASRPWSAPSRAGTTPPSRPPRRCRSSPRAGAPSGSARSIRRSSSTSR